LTLLEGEKRSELDREFQEVQTAETSRIGTVIVNTGKVSCNPALKQCSNRKKALVGTYGDVAPTTPAEDEDWSDKVCVKVTKWWKKTRAVFDKLRNDVYHAIKSLFK